MLSTLAAAHTATLTAEGAPAPVASTSGTTAAFTVAAVVVAIAALVALLVPAPERAGTPEPARV